jgi:hypothetical protein
MRSGDSVMLFLAHKRLIVLSGVIVHGMAVILAIILRLHLTPVYLAPHADIDRYAEADKESNV